MTWKRNDHIVYIVPLQHLDPFQPGVFSAKSLAFAVGSKTSLFTSTDLARFSHHHFTCAHPPLMFEVNFTHFFREGLQTQQGVHWPLPTGLAPPHERQSPVQQQRLLTLAGESPSVCGSWVPVIAPHRSIMFHLCDIKGATYQSRF